MVMRRLCRAIVRWFGPAWGRCGWALFCCWLWLPSLFVHAPFYEALVRLLDGLLLTWWIIDVVDQRAPAWTVNVSSFLLLACLIPRFGLPVVLIWLLYWVYFRN